MGDLRRGLGVTVNAASIGGGRTLGPGRCGAVAAPWPARITGVGSMHFHRTLRVACAAGALLAALPALAQPADVQRPGPSLYTRLGGKPALDALVADALARVATDPRIGSRFAHADPSLATHLADLLCQRAGRPCTYRGRNMADAHEGLRIRDAEFDALMEAVGAAFARRQVPARERDEALRILRQMRSAVVGH